MSRMLFAYFGPETVLPLTSTIAAAVGVALMFGRQLWLGVKLTAARVVRVFRRAPSAPGAVPTRAGKRVDRGPRVAQPHTPSIANRVDS